jgi:thiol-disulfide isomerase/thioredoxin
MLRSLAVLLLLFVSRLPAGIYPNQAPEFSDISAWINSPPLQMANLRGKVVLVDFWDYSCINCIRTFPYLNRWYKTYKDKGFIIVGVHSPEFAFEKDKDNVLAAVNRYGILYPVALDNNFATWRAYSNAYWPASYLIDQEGRIRLRHFGEGNYDEMEDAIRSLLDLPALKQQSSVESRVTLTPEIYLGQSRAANYSSQIQLQNEKTATYQTNAPLNDDEVGLNGTWLVTPESITSKGKDCTITLNFEAGKVHIVLSGKSSEPLTVLLDGKAMPSKYYSKDMDAQGKIFMNGEREYDLVDLHGDVSRHMLTISVPEGISAYTFTFGK